MKTHGESLGEIKNVSEQIVSGINYRMVFNSKSGPVQVTVYCQAWTNTYEVTEMKPYVEENWFIQALFKMDNNFFYYLK